MTRRHFPTLEPLVAGHLRDEGLAVAHGARVESARAVDAEEPGDRRRRVQLFSHLDQQRAHGVAGRTRVRVGIAPAGSRGGAAPVEEERHGASRRRDRVRVRALRIPESRSHADGLCGRAREALAGRRRGPPRGSRASWIVRDASSAAASCAAAIAASVRDARRVTSAHSWRARATALGSNADPRARASTSRVALLSETAARSHASAGLRARVARSRSVDMVSFSRGLLNAGIVGTMLCADEAAAPGRSTRTHHRGERTRKAGTRRAPYAGNDERDSVVAPELVRPWCVVCACVCSSGRV